MDVRTPSHPRRTAAPLLPALCALLAGACGPGGGYGLPAPGSLHGQHVLFVTLDTTRADHLGCYGYAAAQTPVIDALAAGGVRFDAALTAVPVTLPSHSTLFTGLYPPNHGARHNAEYRLDAEHLTLAESLRAAGYETAAFVSAFVLDARYGLDQGFDVYDDHLPPAPGGVFPSGNLERSAAATTDAALAWLEERPAPAGRPFFAWVHYFDPHAPYQPPADLARPASGLLYDGEIAAVDRELGRLLDALDRRGLRSQTLVVVVGDHGEGLGEHGEATHAFFVYDSVMRVPLVIHHPRLVPGVVDALVSTADLTPTLLDLLKVADAQPRDGTSLARARRDGGRSVYLESLPPFLDYGWAPLYALRREQDKYVAAPRSEYYDLAADPGETRNRERTATGAEAARRDELAARLAELRSLWPEDAGAAAAAARPPADEEAAKLRALGYLGGAGDAAGPAPGELRDPKDMVGVVAAVLTANQLLGAGRAADALRMVEEAAARSPGDRSLLHLQAKAHLALGQQREAEAALRAFIAIRPKADVLLLLAQILVLDGRLDEAEGLLDQAADLDPRHGGVWIARGDLLLARGRRAEALAAYDRAAQLDPSRAAGLAAARRQQAETGAPAPE